MGIEGQKLTAGEERLMGTGSGEKGTKIDTDRCAAGRGTLRPAAIERQAIFMRGILCAVYYVRYSMGCMSWVDFRRVV